jgi:N-methylhydantoinase B
MPPCDAVISGGAGDEAYVNQIFLAGAGGGGAPAADGLLCIGTVLAAGVIHRDGVEPTELRYPMEVREQQVIPDSGGAGHFRGAVGNRVEFGPVGTAPMRALYSAAGSVCPARGCRGGLDGAPADQFRRRPDGELERLPAVCDLELAPGETVVSVSCGGGGYGRPRERDPELVAADVREGFVSTARAREVYGVEVEVDGRVDAAATAALRAAGDGTAEADGAALRAAGDGIAEGDG